MRFCIALAIALVLMAAAWAKADTGYHGAQVAIVNQSTSVTADQLNTDLPVFQQLVDTYLAPAWNLQARLYIGTPRAGSDVIYLQDTDTGNCQCYGYHDWRQDRGVAYVYAADSAAMPGGWPFVLTHELEEMLVDPSIDRVTATAGLNDAKPAVMWMVEVSDPVVDASLHLAGLTLADFVLPAWYEPGHLKYRHRFDAAGAVSKPLATTVNGYGWRFANGQWGSYPVAGAPYRVAR